jgi:arylsulfatase A-like enzyme
MRPVQLIDGEKVVEYPLVQATLTKRYTERALSFIERSKDRPFLLYFPQAMPHKPLAASEEFYKKSGSGLYGDVLAELDWSVGQVLGKLKELGLEEKTLVIFTSDNGPWYGGSTGGLRGMKSNNWEGGLRVPLIARWPGRIPAGHISDAPAIMMDVFATALTAAGIPIPTDRVIDGKDLLPLLTSKAASQHEAIFSMLSDRVVSVRSGNWKLHVIPPREQKLVKPEEKWIDPRGPDGVTILAPYEQAHPSEYPGVFGPEPAQALSLFDLSQDPSEQHNVANQHPDVVQRLKTVYGKAVQQRPEAH